MNVRWTSTPSLLHDCHRLQNELKRCKGARSCWCCCRCCPRPLTCSEPEWCCCQQLAVLCWHHQRLMQRSNSIRQTTCRTAQHSIAQQDITGSASDQPDASPAELARLFSVQAFSQSSFTSVHGHHAGQSTIPLLAVVPCCTVPLTYILPALQAALLLLLALLLTSTPESCRDKP